MAYKIEYFRDKCIGVGACVGVAPDIWTIDSPDKRADIVKDKNPTIEGDKQTLEFEEDQLAVIKQSAEVCPVFAIEIVDPSGNKIWPEE